MNRQSFQVRIIGDTVLPQTVKSSDLAVLITNWEEAITRTVQSKFPIVFDPNDAVVSLVGIDEGSDRLTFSVLTIALQAVSFISNTIAARRYEDIPVPAQKAIFEISKQASRKEWAVEIVADEQLQIREAVISDDNPVPPPSPPKATGTTTITGWLLRIGGAKPKAEIRLTDGELILIDVTSTMAKQLGDRLYEEVSIEGEATWVVHDWKIVEFKAKRITEYRPSSVIAAFKELAEASDGTWENIDVEAYVGQLRAEDEG